jgi:fructokinase
VVASPGGSPANVAVTLGRLGLPVRLITQLADDGAGSDVRAWLAASGVEVCATPPAGGRTSTATARLDPNGAASYDFDLHWSIDTPALGDPDAVHVGSVAALLPPGADTVERIVATAAGALISYDPNIRPALIDDPTDARKRVERLVAAAGVVKASEEDLDFLYPHDPPERVARRWLAAGPRLIVVTLGDRGAWAVTADGDVQVPAAKAAVVDTVGAGDTFMGTLIAELLALGGPGRLDSRAVDRILARCAANAAVTVSRPGADPPWAAELPAPTPHIATTNG